jgi:competence protein ComEC
MVEGADGVWGGDAGRLADAARRTDASSPADTGWRLGGLLLAWIAGVAWQLGQPTLWPLGVYAALLLLGGIGLWAAWRWRRVYAIGLLGMALLAAGVTGWQASVRLADALPTALEGRDLVVSGVVASLPKRSSSGLHFRVDVDTALQHGTAVRIPRQLALGWYHGGFHDLRDGAAPAPRQTEPRAGERWRFTVRLRQPHGNLNLHGFDYELYLFEQGVRATGYVRDAAPAPVLLERAAGHPIERLRQRVRDAIEARVQDPRAAGVVTALAVGDQGSISRDDWDLYRNTGVAHLVSISGLHITMFAWLTALLVGALWRRSARAMLRVPAPLAARWGGLACALAYALFSGWGVPSQRTIWMLATVTLLPSLGLRWPWLLVMLLAGAVVTAFDPWALLQPGFWLSFAAVGLLMASVPGQAQAPVADTSDAIEEAPVSLRRRWARRMFAILRDGLRTQVVATLGLAPLTLVFFQQVSLVGFVANLIAIPVVTLVITPLALLGVAFAPLWSAAAWVVQQLNAALGVLAALPGAVWSVPAAPLWAQLAGMLGAVLLVLPLPWRARLLALPLLLPLLAPPRELPPVGAFELMALDVGQGSAVLVRTRAHVLVFDAGPQYSSESDAGSRVLVPLLKARGDTHIDRLVLSHRDLDHVGGARSVLGALRVDELLSSLEAGHPLLALARRSTRCADGQVWEWDGVRFEMLWPRLADYGRSIQSNAMSCVLHISGDRRSVLLTGDIERAQEAELVARAGPALRSDVLMAPHHGSRTSSSAALLDAVQPRVAIFQAGYRNRFRHPSAEVLERYREHGIAIRASPACGAWRWQAWDAATGVCQREAEPRYWHYRPISSAPIALTGPR